MANISNIDPANEMLHVKIESNVPDLKYDGFNPKVVHKDPDWLIPHAYDSGNTTYYLSASTNTSNEERLSYFSLSGNSAVLSGITFQTPIIQVKQHRKSETYSFGGCNIRKYGEDLGAESGTTTLPSKGGSVIVSVYPMNSNDENALIGMTDGEVREMKERFKLSKVYSFIKPVGNPYLNEEGNRIEWVCKVDRNDTFETKTGIITVSFEYGSAKKTKSVFVNVTEKEHTDTQPVLYIDEISVNNGANSIDFESYYTFDGVKKPIDNLWCKKEGDENFTRVDDNNSVTYTYNPQTFSGKINLPANGLGGDTVVPQAKYSFYTSTDTALKSGSLSTIRIVYQDGYVPVEDEYTFNITPQSLPNKAKTVESGVTTWINHITNNPGTYYVKVDSQRNGEFYESGVTVTYNVGNSSSVRWITHGWVYSGDANTGVYKIEIRQGNNTISERPIMFTFTQKPNNRSEEIGKYCYKLIQMDKNSVPLHGSDNASEPNYILATMGSDLLTGSGFTASAKVFVGETEVASIGNDENQLGDSSTMRLCWGGENTNYYGNQYIAFSPKAYIDENGKDVKVEVYGRTHPNGCSNGIISMNIEATQSKPVLSRSYNMGIKNTITSSGVVAFSDRYYGRISGETSTKLFAVERYHNDDTLWLRRNSGTIPKYSDNTNYGYFRYALHSNVECASRLSADIIDEPINACLIAKEVDEEDIIENEYHSYVTHMSGTQNIYTTTSSSVFERLELYYDMTSYRVVAIKIHGHVYDNSHEPFSDFVLSDYDLTNPEDTITLVFDNIDEVNTYESDMIERNVLLETDANFVPQTAFNGWLMDMATKKSTKFTIPAATPNTDGSKRKIYWQDVSDGSKEPNRLLKITKIDEIVNARIYDTKTGITWWLMGFRNIPDTSVPVRNTYTHMDSFNYGFNSSTPRLLMGFYMTKQEYWAKTVLLIGFNLNYIFNCLDLDSNNQYYFREGNWQLNIYKWNKPDENAEKPRLYHMFLAEGTPDAEQLTEAVYLNNSQVSFGDISTGGTAETKKFVISDKGFEFDDDIVIRLRMFDSEHNDVKRMDVAYAYKYRDLIKAQDATIDKIMVLAGKYVYKPGETYDCHAVGSWPNKYVTNMNSDERENAIKSLVIVDHPNEFRTYIDV